MKKNIFLSKSHTEFISEIEHAIEHNFLPMDEELKEYDWRKLSSKFRNKLIDINE